jgi:hypothetical protein
VTPSIWQDRRVVPADIHDFFAASGGAAAALIGLLFVAISVSAERLAREETGAQLHRVRAAAALSSFINALTISLFALIPGEKIAWTAVAVAIGGLTFVVAATLSLIRAHEIHWGTLRDGLFLILLVVTFVIQLLEGAQLVTQPANSGDVNTIAILVVVCFLIGIARAWELIGGPSIGIRREVTALARRPVHGAHGEHGAHGADTPNEGQPPTAGS